MDATNLGAELIGLHDHPRQTAPFSARYPGLSAESGYIASRALHAHRLAQGWRPAGRKIGFTNRTIWPRYGVYEPIWGFVYDQTLVRAPDNVAAVSLRGLVQPRIEPEICFGLKSAPPATRDAAELLSCIDWIAHSVEIVHCYHPEWKLQLPDSIAANGLHGRLIVGKQVPVTEISGLAEALPSLKLVLKKDGKTIDRGVGSNVLDSPLLALAYVIELLAKQEKSPPLAAGELITTGTLTDAHPVASGERWSTELLGLPLPGLEIEFA